MTDEKSPTDAARDAMAAAEKAARVIDEASAARRAECAARNASTAASAELEGAVFTLLESLARDTHEQRQAVTAAAKRFCARYGTGT